MEPVSSFYIKKSAEPFDAIVVGSGITGGWAAKELCERGLRTLMVERGRPVEHQKDYWFMNKLAFVIFFVSFLLPLLMDVVKRLRWFRGLTLKP